MAVEEVVAVVGYNLTLRVECESLATEVTVGGGVVKMAVEEVLGC